MTASFPPLDDAPLDDASFDDAAVEALLSGAGDPADPLTGALRALRGEAGRVAPEPTPALAELLGDGPPPDELGRRRRAARITIGVVVAGSATLALSGVAAAHDALPDPAQRVVTDIVNDLTPFHIGPGQRVPRLPVAPAPTDTSVPGAGAGPSPTSEDRPSAHPGGSSGPGRSHDRSGDRHDGGSGDGGSRAGSGDGKGAGSGGGGSDDRTSSGSGSGGGGDSGDGDSGDGDSGDGGSGGGGGGGGGDSGGGGDGH